MLQPLTTLLKSEKWWIKHFKKITETRIERFGFFYALRLPLGMRIVIALLLFTTFIHSKLSAQDSFQVYLTPDIAVNSCLLAWDEFEVITLKAIRNDKLKLYDGNGERYKSKEAIERQLSLAAYDEKIKDTLFMPLDYVQFQIKDKALYAFHPNPFSGDTHTIGRLDLEKVMKICPEPSASILKGISQYTDFLKEDAFLNEVTVYTYSLLAFDSLQKQVSALSGEKKPLSVYSKTFERMDDSTRQGEITELVSVPSGTGGFKDQWQQIPEEQMWKGMMAAGHTDRNQVYINHWGLLIHPETKFVGWNPGKIVWFYVDDSQLNRKFKSEKKFLDGIFYYAQLHLLDPDEYRCKFYKDNAIRIENTRYPKRH